MIRASLPLQPRRTWEPVVTMRILFGSCSSKSLTGTSSAGENGARPTFSAASRYVVRLSPMKHICRPAASAAAFTLFNL